MDARNKNLKASEFDDKDSINSNRDLASRETAHFRLTFSSHENFYDLEQVTSKKRSGSNPNR